MQTELLTLKFKTMQINPYSPILKEAVKYLGWILLFLVLWFRGCSGTTPLPQIVKVKVPEVKGKFETKKPVNVPIVQKVSTGETVYKDNPIDPKLLAENEKLKQDFAKANDSIKKLSFAKAVQLNEFSTDFEDENIVLNINGIVQGEVKEITPNYTIKEKKIEVPVKQKETVFRLLGGMELGNNTKLDGFAAKANLIFQNRKGNELTTSFDTNQNIWIGYNFSIVNIKR
jgi:hypothetical protein